MGKQAMAELRLASQSSLCPCTDGQVPLVVAASAITVMTKFRSCQWWVDDISITVRSSWARWRLKSPAPQLLVQPFVQAQIKENIKAPRHWPLCRDSPHKRPVTRKMFPFNDAVMRQDFDSIIIGLDRLPTHWIPSLLFKSFFFSEGHHWNNYFIA